MKKKSDPESGSTFHIRDCTSQADRLLPALKDRHFDLVDMRFHVLMAMAVDYAEKMRFINLNLKQEGYWKPYFNADETVMIALMLSTDTVRLIKQFKHRQYPAKHRPEAVQALQAVLPAAYRNQFIALYCVAGILDSWLVALRTSDTVTGHELHKLIEGIITGLGGDLEGLVGCISRFLPEKPLEVFFSQDIINLLIELRTGGRTNTRTTDNTDNTARMATGSAHAPDLSDPVAVSSSFHALIKAIEMIQIRAVKLLPATLQNQQHDPAAGLLIAFVRLLERLHQKINRFATNYIDFYYDQVLGAQPHPFRQDHMYLVAQLSQKNKTVAIPKNTVFPVKLADNPQVVNYVTEEEVYVHGATVVAVHTLYFNRDPLNSPENVLFEKCPGRVDYLGLSKTDRQLATECQWNTIQILTEENIQEQGSKRTAPHFNPVFGASKDSEHQSFFGEHARVGFALASKTLLLKEGNRRIQITLEFAGMDKADATAGPGTLADWVREIALVLKSSPEEDGAEAIYSEEKEHDSFYKVFSNFFMIQLTTETGWLDVEEYVPAYGGVDATLGKNSLRIALTLPPDTPSILPYSSAVHGEQYETQLPVIRFTLNPRGYLYPYGLLDKLVLNAIHVDVTVSGYRSVMLHNQLGPLSAQASFSPFGPLPEVGSYLLVGCPEATVKQLSRFSVEVQWGGLPSGMGGFKSYYRGYNGPQDYNDFKISKSVLSEGKWFPESSEPALTDTLFQASHSTQSTNFLDNCRVIACDGLLPYWNAIAYQNMPEETGYKPSMKNEFFKFMLIESSEAFGHKKYPQIFSGVLTHNARQRLMKKIREEPNAPYTPLIDTIHVNYQASARITGKKTGVVVSQIFQDQLIHLHPAGWENDVMKPGRTVTLVPDYPFSGNLLIGLKDFEPGKELTLYFYLRENALPSERVIRQKLHWFYLSANQWVPLSDRQVISDSTQGFMTSGIVMLDIPASINRDNTVMPDGLCWLRVSAETDLEKFCSLYSIYAQGIKVVRTVNQDETDDSHNSIFKPVPPGSIKQPQQSIPGLDSVWQVQASMGGKSAEDKEALWVRMSERVWHKNRAIQPVDYERMIPEHFPQLYKVKCFANLLPDHDTVTQQVSPRIRTGHVTLALLPYPDYRRHQDGRLWVSGHLVSEVQEFVTGYISPFVTVHFVNPVYETVQMRCTVKLKRKRSAGKLIEQLNEAISAFVSPWDDVTGYTAHFGWRISKHEIQSYIQQLDYIDRVTNFSLLRITPQGKALYALTDSAAENRTSKGFSEITPQYPWSIAVPMRQHFIEVDDSFDMIDPQVTGLGELEIGSTFIISDRYSAS